MAVANICEGMRREKIVQACQKVSVMLGKQISSANKPSSKILMTKWHKLKFIWASSAFTWHGEVEKILVSQSVSSQSVIESGRQAESSVSQLLCETSVSQLLYV